MDAMEDRNSYLIDDVCIELQPTDLLFPVCHNQMLKLCNQILFSLRIRGGRYDLKPTLRYLESYHDTLYK